MAGILPQQVLFSCGGDVLAKYGTLVKRYAPPARGGETPYTFTRAGTAWAVAANGLLLPHAANTPRVEWVIDPISGVLQPYLLLEAPGTNSILQSENLPTSWTLGNVTLGGAGTITDPTGASLAAADKLIETAVNAAHYVGQAFTITSGQSIAGRCYFRPGERTKGRVYFSDAGSTNRCGADIDATAGTAVAFTAGAGVVTAGPFIRALPGLLYEVTWAGTINGGVTAANLFCLLRNAAGVEGYLGDITQGAYYVGMQAEIGATFPSSYIKTTTLAVTRNADTFTVPWYGNFPTWLYARWLERGTLLDSSATSRGIVQVGGSGVARLLLLKEGATQIPRGLFTDNVNFTRSSPVGTPTYGQAVEALLQFYPADGSVQVLQAINNGAVSDGGRSAALGATVPLSSPGNILALASQAAGAADGWGAFSRVLGGVGSVPDLPTARAIPV